eukprot:1194344-Prorocentrum_minimum.AAC.1
MGEGLPHLLADGQREEYSLDAAGGRLRCPHVGNGQREEYSLDAAGRGLVPQCAVRGIRALEPLLHFVVHRAGAVAQLRRDVEHLRGLVARAHPVELPRRALAEGEVRRLLRNTESESEGRPSDGETVAHRTVRW